MSLAQRFWLILSAVLLATVLMLAVFGDRLIGGSPTWEPAQPVRAASGVGDPYLPEAGGAGYDVEHYDVRINAVSLGDEIRGTTTVTALARQDLDEFHLDLYLSVRSVMVNGAPASYAQQADDLAVTASRPRALRTPSVPSALTENTDFTSARSCSMQSCQRQKLFGTGKRWKFALRRFLKRRFQSVRLDSFRA